VREEEAEVQEKGRGQKSKARRYEVIRRTALLLTLLGALLAPAVARADFGFVPGETTFNALNRDGTIATQAGIHPYAFTLHFELKTNPDGTTEGGAMRDTVLDLPPGLFGNPQAVPTCPRQDFEGALPQCAPSTQIGVLRAILPELKSEAIGPIYNITPPPGVAAQFGFSSIGFIALFSATLTSENEYAVHIDALNLPLEASSATATLWGTPADPAHDPERGPSGGLSSNAPLVPFLTLPTSCDFPPELVVQADSKLAPGLFVGGGEPALMRDKAGHPISLTGCESVPFSPQVLAAPSTTAAESPAGLSFQLKLPNQGLLNPKEGSVVETEPEAIEVELPAGITPNPAVASGLGTCTPGQYESASTVSGPGQGCPQSSKLGTLVGQAPLLEEAIEGSVYLATPHDNPFDSLLAVYVVAEVPQRGVLAKVADEIQANPLTGQLTTVIEELPPAPYSSLELHLRDGPEAPLITPQTCGTYATTAWLYPFSDPEVATELSTPFKISSGAGGGKCASIEAQLPNTPTLLAGATAPIAGAYSPFVLKLSRADGEQRFSSLEVTPPEGLVGKLADIPYCSDAQIAAAAARTGEGEGAAEVANPSCPAASQIGTAIAGAGAGPAPYYVTGKAYLAGPYKGAPLSAVIITPAIAGPFDLGVVVVRAAIYVDERTAKITVKSDSLPTILHGIPLDVRSASVLLDRQDFTLNPTSCAEKLVSARSTSTAGGVAELSNRFQVGDCRNLPFSPKLQLSLSGATTRAKHPAFKAVLTQAQGQANLKKLSLTLPPTEFIDPNHVANPCTRPQFAEHKCPSSSVLGKVRAFTPLLDKPLEGPIYFRANGGERELPDAVADLNGQVHLVSVGFVDALHHKGSEESRIRTTIATVPDAPISKVIIELKGGKKHGLLVNSANICKSANRALVKMWGQNGKVQSSEPKIAVECTKKRAS
jgi:hypothetical protein